MVFHVGEVSFFLNFTLLHNFFVIISLEWTEYLILSFVAAFIIVLYYTNRIPKMSGPAAAAEKFV